MNALVNQVVAFVVAEVDTVKGRVEWTRFHRLSGARISTLEVSTCVGWGLVGIHPAAPGAALAVSREWVRNMVSIASGVEKDAVAVVELHPAQSALSVAVTEVRRAG